MGHLDVVVLLIAAGADVNIALMDIGETPLSVAAYGGYADVVAQLAAAPGVDVNLVGLCRLTPSKPVLNLSAPMI